MRRIIKDKKSIIAILVLFFLMFAYLLYNYSFGNFDSDYAAHIRQALRGEGYSLVTVLINLFCGVLNSKILFSLFMAFVITMTAISCSMFIKSILKLMNIKIETNNAIILALSTLFICKICIPDWSTFYYKESLATQSWHNSTYTLMRFFSMFSLSFYFIIQKDYINKVNYKQLAIFTTMLLLTNFSKPSFIIVFAPIMLFVLIYDFCKTKTKSFKNAFLFGMCVLISSIILIIQFNLIFDEKNSVMLSVVNAINYFINNKKFVLYFILNFAYPIYITYLIIKNRKFIDNYSKAIFIQTWSMYILSFLESLLLIEVGPRYSDGNFGWGAQLFAYILFVVCICMEIKMKKEKLLNDIQYTIANYTYIIHILFGVCYFVLLCLGYYYYF